MWLISPYLLSSIVGVVRNSVRHTYLSEDATKASTPVVDSAAMQVSIIAIKARALNIAWHIFNYSYKLQQSDCFAKC